MESNSLSKISYSEEFFTGVVLNSSLAESMRMKDDYIQVTFMNEFDHIDYDF